MIKSNRMRLAGHVERMGEKSNAYRTSMEKPEGRRPLERPKRRWMDSIKMCHREIGLGAMNWIDVAQDSVYTVMKLQVP
jgi:hypothetical protein